LAESAVWLVRRSPANLFLFFFWLLKGRVAFKGLVAANCDFSAERLPYREPLLAYLRSEKEKGRRIILATASHKNVAAEVSRHLGIFDDVIATDNVSNLKGKNKLKAIQTNVGENFVYAGNSAADIVIWKSAKAAVLVDTSASTAKAARNATPIEAEYPRERKKFRTWARALRIHQWSKNLLIFVPLLMAFSFLDIKKLSMSVIAFLAFSLAASATYIVNDLWDLESDRAHPRKALRPLASAEVSIVDAVAISSILLVAALILALLVSQQFFLTLLLYLLVTSCYSWFLKKYALVDVIVLALLYALRIFAGSVAIEVTTSTWLMVFSVFMFLSLALVKRCSELVDLKKSGGESTHGRDYRVSDLIVLWPLGLSSAVSAVVVFGLFISVPETTARYGSPALLWFVALGLIYWLARLWIKTSRGEMHDDPIVYAIKDRAGQLVVSAMIVIIVCAYFIQWDSILGQP
jgi:4-hydroxybenzoate polyprenyltransferase